MSSTNSFPHDLTCGICLDVFTTPVRTSCGHTMCHKCWIQVQAKKPECPFCRSCDVTIVMDKNLNMRLYNLPHRRVCGTFVSDANMEMHVSECMACKRDDMRMRRKMIRASKKLFHKCVELKGNLLSMKRSLNKSNEAHRALVLENHKLREQLKSIQSRQFRYLKRQCV